MSVKNSWQRQLSCSVDKTEFFWYIVHMFYFFLVAICAIVSGKTSTNSMRGKEDDQNEQRCGVQAEKTAY
jgi:hypothetical protein